jgi:hypothetical protein
LFLVRQHARPSGPVFRQKFTDKGWHEWIPARRKETMALNTRGEVLGRLEPVMPAIG